MLFYKCGMDRTKIKNLSALSSYCDNNFKEKSVSVNILNFWCKLYNVSEKRDTIRRYYSFRKQSKRIKHRSSYRSNLGGGINAIL